jgi:hypothetical protein
MFCRLRPCFVSETVEWICIVFDTTRRSSGWDVVLFALRLTPYIAAITYRWVDTEFNRIMLTDLGTWNAVIKNEIAEFVSCCVVCFHYRRNYLQRYSLLLKKAVCFVMNNSLFGILRVCAGKMVEFWTNSFRNLQMYRPGLGPTLPLV